MKNHFFEKTRFTFLEIRYTVQGRNVKVVKKEGHFLGCFWVHLGTPVRRHEYHFWPKTGDHFLDRFLSKKWFFVDF